jgi:hypothetical protein
LYILTFTFFDSRRRDKMFWIESATKHSYMPVHKFHTVCCIYCYKFRKIRVRRENLILAATINPEIYTLSRRNEYQKQANIFVESEATAGA